MAVRTSFTAGEVLAAADLTDTFGAKANLASPTFTGTPAAPTAAAGTNTTQIATTAFVQANSGKVLQVVRATDTTDRSTSSTSYVDASISVTITPTKNTSNIILIWSFDATGSTARTVSFQITDSANVGVSGAENADHTFAASYDAHMVLIGYASPATTSAVTYKGRFKAGATNTLTLQNASGTGQLFAIEVAA